MDWQEAVLKETLQEYLMTFEQMTNKLEALDRRIEELAQGTRLPKGAERRCSTDCRTSEQPS